MLQRQAEYPAQLFKPYYPAARVEKSLKLCGLLQAERGELKSIKIEDDVYERLVKLKGDLMAREGRPATFSDVLRRLINLQTGSMKALREAEKA
jgi:predicted CopG family antitoxin